MVFALTVTNLLAQLSPDRFTQLLNQPSLLSLKLTSPAKVKSFYALYNYQFAWLVSSSHPVNVLTQYLLHSTEWGLSNEDYQPVLVRSILDKTFSPATEADSFLAEIKLTDAAIHFFEDVLRGNESLTLSYNGLNYMSDCYNTPQLLAVYLSDNRLEFLLNDAESKEPEYIAVKQKLKAFSQQVSQLNFKDAKIISDKISPANKPLVERLFQLGIFDADTTHLTTEIVKNKVKEAEELFGLLKDGLLRKTFLQAANVPLRYRIKELSYTLNTIRRLNCIKQTGHTVVVNIPSATLLLYAKGKVILESRIIVGKPSTKTPTLSSRITEVILYPYWNVPFKIATTELLPVIKRNRGYLNENNFQVLDNAGRVVDPAKVNWRALSAAYFPYTIRQSTGCDNSLGLIKLNFYNPFSVYLHDTPYKLLFKSYRRFYSHGCMRVERAMEVGRYLLKGNEIAIDTLEDKGCLNNQQPIIVPAAEAIPVFVLYNTAWFDSSGRVVLYGDVYEKMKAILK